MGHRSDIDLATANYSLLQEQVDELMNGNPMSLRYDQDADPATYAYLGTAVPGTNTNAALWRIQKLTFSPDGDVVATWADGNANFDNIWDNRASLTYS